jgi:hypothetical protein
VAVSFFFFFFFFFKKKKVFGVGFGGGGGGCFFFFFFFFFQNLNVFAFALASASSHSFSLQGRFVTALAAMSSSSLEFSLRNPPTDGISRVRFLKKNNRFLVCSSWDKTVRCYDVSTNEITAQHTYSAPVLDAVVADTGTVVLSGGLDKQLHSKRFVFNFVMYYFLKHVSRMLFLGSTRMRFAVWSFLLQWEG